MRSSRAWNYRLLILAGRANSENRQYVTAIYSRRDLAHTRGILPPHIKIFNKTNLYIFLFTLSIVSAQEVDITGTVTDRNGDGVQGATVSLVDLSVSTGTDAHGNYELNSSTAIGKQADLMLRQNRVLFKNNVLFFTIHKPGARVSIGMYTLRGKSAVTLVDGVLQRGSYRIPVPMANMASQVCFLRITIHGTTCIQKISVVNDRLLHTETSIVPAVQPLKQAKSFRAVSDSIIVEKPGYSQGHRRIDSYIGVHDFIIVDTAWFWGDRSSIPNPTNVMVYVFLNRTNGAFSDNEVYWQEPGGGAWHSIAQQQYYHMGVGSSGRLTFSVGQQGGQYWDFEEHTIAATVWNGNTTRVDGWRLPFAIRLHCSDGYDEILGEEYDIFYMGRDAVFDLFKESVPEEFDHCADNGHPYRIIAPGKGDGGFGPGQQYANYMTPYLQDLGYGSSSTESVFACTGTFGGNAQLAGAVNRHVAHLNQSEWGDHELFDQEAPANFYAKFWHEHSFQGKAYGFAYDDAEGYAAYTSHSNPRYLLFAIGY